MARLAVERGLNEAAYWVEQQQKQLEGTAEIYMNGNYRQLSKHNKKNSKPQKNEIESQFVNLAFEMDFENDRANGTHMYKHTKYAYHD